MCFAGSQILARGIVGWWPFLGTPDVHVHLVKVEVSPSSGRIALIAFAGFRARATQSAAKLFVADREGEEMVEVCGGAVMDMRWSRDGDDLYLLRNLGARRHPSKSLWRYTASTRKLTHVRQLPRRTAVLSLDPGERRLLFTNPSEPKSDGRFLLICGQVGQEKDDRTVCWREGWLGGHTWGPKTGNIFVATNEESSLGDGFGLWMIKSDREVPTEPVSLLEMQGIEAIKLNDSETHAALFVRRRPPPSIDFDLYVLNLAERSATPIAPNVECGSAVWDRKGEKLAFADSDGLKTYNTSTGHVRLLVEAPPSWLHPEHRERLRALSYDRSGDILFQAGLWRLEKYRERTGNTRTLLHRGQMRRYFRT